MRRLIRLAGLGLVAAAVAKELGKPAAERAWQGWLASFVPYDFTRPTLEKLRRAYWNPDDDRIFTPMPLGVGWAVNLPALLRKLQADVAESQARE